MDILNVDIARLLTILLLLAVVAVYVKTVLELGMILVRRHSFMSRFVYHLNLGRLIGSVGVIILALAVIEGHAERWHEPLSVRVPLSVIAASALLWGWYNSSRFVFRTDVPSITREDILEDAERNK